MARRSTRLIRTSLLSFTCDGCWDGFNAYADGWDDAEAQATCQGWRFTGRGMSARDWCGRCAP